MLAFVTKYKQIGDFIFNRHDDRQDWRTYREELLDRCRKVRREAQVKGLLGLQPEQARFLSANVAFIGWCNVPGVYVDASNRPKMFVFGPDEYLEEWRAQMLVLRDAAGSQSTKGHRKRRELTEQAPDQRIARAFVIHHKYKDGIVGNPTPASLEAIWKLAFREGQGSRMAVTRFLQSEFGLPGHKNYAAACHRDLLLRKLKDWSGEEKRARQRSLDDTRPTRPRRIPR